MPEDRAPGVRASTRRSTSRPTSGRLARPRTARVDARRKSGAKGSSKRRRPGGREDSRARKAAMYSAVRLALPRIAPVLRDRQRGPYLLLRRSGPFLFSGHGRLRPPLMAAGYGQLREGYERATTPQAPAAAAAPDRPGRRAGPPAARSP